MFPASVYVKLFIQRAIILEGRRGIGLAKDRLRDGGSQCWFPWRRTGRGRMAPRVNRWPMSPYTEVRHCVTFSPFVITNADWSIRCYLASYLIVAANNHELYASKEYRLIIVVDHVSFALAFEPGHWPTPPWTAAFVAPRKLTTLVKSLFSMSLHSREMGNDGGIWLTEVAVDDVFFLSQIDWQF